MSKKTAEARKNVTRTVTLALVCLLAAGRGVSAESFSQAPRSSGRILVKLADETSPRGGFGSVKELKQVRKTATPSAAEWYVAEVKEGTSLEEALAELANDPAVEFVEAELPRSIPTPVQGSSFEGSTNDPGAADQYALERIQAEEAWTIHGGSRSVVVAVLDSGVQLDHPDLEQQMWTNTRETLNGQDDDGNGYVDDVAGWDFVSGDNDPSDDNGHGTHCAGIIAAARDNGFGIAGAANVSIMPLKVLDANGGGSTSGILEAVHYAINNGADVISMSLGGGSPSQAMADACAEAVNRNIVVVAATGNDSSPIEFPAAYDSVIAVAATDQNDNLASFSNFGEGLDISAPGVDILSTLPGSQFGPDSGTSMATPYVAGIAALIRSNDPGLSATEIRNRLANSADDLGDNGYDTTFGYGRLNAHRALSGTGNQQPQDPTPTPNPMPGNDDQFEENDSMDQAREIEPGTFNLSGKDEDWFFLPLDGNGQFDVRISGNGGDLDLFALDLNGYVIAESTSETSSESVSGSTHERGVLIVVAPYEGNVADYTMSITATTSRPQLPEEEITKPFPDELPTDAIITVPVTCGVGAVQMMCAMLVGLVSVTHAQRRTRRSRR